MTQRFRGIHRITTPLPSRPSSVHAYLVPLDAGGWMLVDGGVDTPDAWAALSTGVEMVSGWKQLSLHVVTHMHLDHLGLARRVRDASSVPLAMGAIDAERAAHAAANPDEEDEYRDALLQRSGAPDQVREAVRSVSARARSLSPFTAVDYALATTAAELVEAPEWMVIWTPGHTAGHISLYRERDRCLIAGDAVLPTISPTIGVNRQREDPIADYLGTLDALQGLDPELILAGHGAELEGTARIQELRAETLDESDRVLALLRTGTPSSAWELSGERYANRELPLTARMQALRETLAHLEHLVSLGAAHRIEGENVGYVAA
jgi:glyoxylase-like metal-dependent hydrolase (beta-lactamase superfamily II)